MLESLLQKLGLKDKEIKIYLAAVKGRSSTPAAIAKITKINRATVYSVIKALISKGLLIEDLGAKSFCVLPSSPEDLKQLLKKEEAAFRDKEKLVRDFSNQLSLLGVDSNYPVPKIRFVEEDKLQDYLYRQGETWNKSAIAADSIWWGFQDDSFVKLYPKWLDWMWKSTPVEVSVKLLSNQSDIEKRVRGKYKRREIKFWNKTEAFTATTWVIGSYIVVISTAQKPYYLIEIHDALLAHNMREVFKNLWPIIR